MKNRHALLLVALLVALSVQGCGSAPRVRDADCSARLRFSDTTYRPNFPWRMPVRGERLGRAGYLDCDGSQLGRTAIFAVGGADPTQAVIATSRGGDGLYVAEDTPRSEWPAVVRTADHYLRCTEPTTFTGSWDYIVTHSRGAGPYRDDVPYLAVFTAQSGAGIDPNTWAWATIRATVTQDTDPVPSVETARTAIRDRQPVTVSTTCTDDGRFEVTHLELAHRPGS